MVLVARQAALSVIPEENCSPLVCDFATADDLPTALPLASSSTQYALRNTQHTPRLITFFGMLPNFEPATILPRLAALLRPNDHLLLSANLAPGPHYAAGVQRILPLYDNALTRDWLLTFLLDLGVEHGDGQLRCIIEDDPAGSGFKRVAAYFHFLKAREIRIETNQFEFRPGDAIRLFFSYRHTPVQVRSLLERHGLLVLDHWITRSEDEGVFLVVRSAGSQ
jgi:hypothetical protein